MLKRLFGELFYVDLRSLAAMRMALGLVVIADLALRARYLEAHYTDLGGVPAPVVLQKYGASVYLSLHYWVSGIPALVALLFVAHGLVAAMFAAGWRTRIANAVLWYLTASLLTRTPLLHTVGDMTLQLMLFWSLFLPLGARWSLDALRRPEWGGTSNRYVSAASLAILAQICLIYMVAAAQKLLTDMWVQGDAVAFALSLDAYSTGPGAWMLRHKGLLAAATYATMVVEGLGPLVAFIPGFTGPGRLAAVIIFALLHVSFGVFLRLDIFPYMSVAALLVLLPTGLWDRIAPGSRAVGPGPHAMLRPPKAVNVAAVAFLAFVVVLNVRALGPMQRVIPSSLSKLGNALRLRQGWGMFTDEQSINGWYVIGGRQPDGTVADLLSGSGPVSFETPEVASRAYGSARRAQFLYAHRDIQASPFWEPYARYLCRRWNRDHDDGQRIEQVTIWFMLRKTDLLGADQRIYKVKIHDAECDEDQPVP